MEYAIHGIQGPYTNTGNNTRAPHTQSAERHFDTGVKNQLGDKESGNRQGSKVKAAMTVQNLCGNTQPI